MKSRLIAGCMLFVTLSVFVFFAESAQRKAETVGKKERLETPEKSKLDMAAFIRLVKERNEQALSQQYQVKISQEEITKAESIFETQLISSARYLSDNQRLSQQDYPSDIYYNSVRDAENSNLGIKIEQVVPTGAILSLETSYNSYEDSLDSVDREHRSVVSANITQPLLKNRGIEPTMAGIKIARAEAYITKQNYRRQLMELVFKAGLKAFDYYGAVRKHWIQQESVKIAEKVLQDNEARVRSGKMPETELLEARAALALRRSLQRAAALDIHSAKNALLSFISSTETQKPFAFDFDKYVQQNTLNTDLDACIASALKSRPEYLAVLEKIKQQDIQIAFRKNQKLPELDLKASYGLNGLSDSPGNSWDQISSAAYPEWSVGLEFKVPLWGNLKDSSELNIARYKKRQALLELKSIETAIQNDIRTAVETVFSLKEQTQYYHSAAEFNRQLRDVELTRLNRGKSKSRIVFDKEKNYNIAQYSEIESYIKEKKSQLALKLEKGSLLEEFGVDPLTNAAEQ